MPHELLVVLATVAAFLLVYVVVLWLLTRYH